MITKQLIWRNRLVKMLDNSNIAMSRVGDWCDFEFFPEKHSADIPLALNIMGADVYDFEIAGDNLRIRTVAGTFLIVGNPADGGFVKKEDEYAV